MIYGPGGRLNFMLSSVFLLTSDFCLNSFGVTATPLRSLSAPDALLSSLKAEMLEI